MHSIANQMHTTTATREPSPGADGGSLPSTCGWLSEAFSGSTLAFPRAALTFAVVFPGLSSQAERPRAPAALPAGCRLLSLPEWKLECLPEIGSNKHLLELALILSFYSITYSTSRWGTFFDVPPPSTNPRGLSHGWQHTPPPSLRPHLPGSAVLWI